MLGQIPHKAALIAVLVVPQKVLAIDMTGNFDTWLHFKNFALISNSLEFKHYVTVGLI